MRSNSLAFRLAASAAIISIILFVAAGVLLADLFKSAVERNFDERLYAILDGVLSNVEVADDGRTLTLPNALADTRFGLPLSGWYWQVAPVGQPPTLASASLLDQKLAPSPVELAARDSEGVASFYLLDANATQLRGIEQRYRIRRQQHRVLGSRRRQLRRAEGRDLGLHECPRARPQHPWPGLPRLGHRPGALRPPPPSAPAQRAQLGPPGRQRPHPRRLSRGGRADRPRAQSHDPGQHRDRRARPHPGRQPRPRPEDSLERPQQRGRPSQGRALRQDQGADRHHARPGQSLSRPGPSRRPRPEPGRHLRCPQRRRRHQPHARPHPHREGHRGHRRLPWSRSSSAARSRIWRRWSAISSTTPANGRSAASP